MKKTRIRVVEKYNGKKYYEVQYRTVNMLVTEKLLNKNNNA